MLLFHLYYYCRRRHAALAGVKAAISWAARPGATAARCASASCPRSPGSRRTSARWPAATTRRCGASKACGAGAWASTRARALHRLHHDRGVHRGGGGGAAGRHGPPGVDRPFLRAARHRGAGPARAGRRPSRRGSPCTTRPKRPPPVAAGVADVARRPA